MSPTLTGGCNCGAVRFEITEPLFDARYCHCTRCQRRTGAAASANASVALGSFRIVSGEDVLKSGDRTTVTRSGSVASAARRSSHAILRTTRRQGCGWARSTVIWAFDPNSASSSPTRLPGRRSPTTSFPTTPSDAGRDLHDSAPRYPAHNAFGRRWLVRSRPGGGCDVR